MPHPLVAPSILSADFARLGAAVAGVAAATDWVHVDVMDQHFVPNLTLGLPVVQSLRAATKVRLDCHLMIEDPETWAPRYAAAADSVTVHAEAAAAPRGVAASIRDAGARAGLAIKPGTPLADVAAHLDAFDLLLVMTVEPGFGGQRFLAGTLPKVRQARQLLDDAGLALWLQVDGGINAETIERCAEAGADVFVAGSAVYGAEDPAAAVRGLAAAAARASERLRG